MKIVLTGASGLIGGRVASGLDGHALTVLGRRAPALPGARFAEWDAMAGPAPADTLDGADAVIHLAGEPIAQRWTDAAKARIRDSRVSGTRHLVDGMRRAARPPGTLVCASAIGIYGSRGDEVLTESCRPGHGFLADLCAEWEREAEAAAALGARVVRMRLGIVLALEGGALKQMLPPFRAGVGGRVASGRQWMSWIHIHDVVGILRFAIENAGVQGAVNATAPAPVTNSEFTRALGAALHRPAVFPVPAFALRLIFGEMSELLLSSQRVVPVAAEAAGYRFRHAELRKALEDLFR